MNTSSQTLEVQSKNPHS